MSEAVEVTFLGGLGEVGRNCTVIEVGGKLLLVDFGVMFPDGSMPGVDVILPDTSWLRSRADDVVGLIVTHAHEDHVGGITYLLREIEVPVYGSPLSIAVARHKAAEAGLDRRASFHPLSDGQRVLIGPFDVEVLPITHSVPQSLCVVIHTPQGVLVHTGDFKLDASPVDGRVTDCDRLAELATSEGIRLLMADSTNADVPGESLSESAIGDTFRRLFPTASGRRLVVSCFASHLHRVQQIVDEAIAQGRLIFPLGRSMVTNIRLARELGVLDLPDRHVRSIDEVAAHPPERVCVVCTGSQGESVAALALLARGEHADLSLGQGDVVILSSHPIPGNERAVYRVIDELTRRGCEVIHDGMEVVHTTGHAKREELRALQRLTRPEWFVPIEGEYRMLERHAGLAVEEGADPDRVLLALDGDRLVITEDGVRLGDRIPAPYHYLDGPIDDLGPGVLAERRALAASGFVHVTIVLSGSGVRCAPPAIATRGWIDADLSAETLARLEIEIRDAVDRAVAAGARSAELERVVRRTTGRYVGTTTQRRPPVSAEVIVID